MSICSLSISLNDLKQDQCISICAQTWSQQITSDKFYSRKITVENPYSTSTTTFLQLNEKIFSFKYILGSTKLLVGKKKNRNNMSPEWFQ